VHPGKLEAVKGGFPHFVEKTATEKKNLFYGFTLNGTKFSAAKATPMPKAFSPISIQHGSRLSEPSRIGETPASR
jgi:hypothetical protein